MERILDAMKADMLANPRSIYWTIEFKKYPMKDGRVLISARYLRDNDWRYSTEIHMDEGLTDLPASADVCAYIEGTFGLKLKISNVDRRTIFCKFAPQNLDDEGIVEYLRIDVMNLEPINKDSCEVRIRASKGGINEYLVYKMTNAKIYGLDLDECKALIGEGSYTRMRVKELQKLRKRLASSKQKISRELATVATYEKLLEGLDDDEKLLLEVLD